MMKKTIFLLVFNFVSFALLAQNSVVSSGGNAAGTGGSTSFSLGQIGYTYQQGATGSVSAGVQQPFEIFTLDADNFPEITLTMTVYPNPTVGNVTLKIGDFNLEKLSYLLSDISGKQLAEVNLSDQETQIQLDNLNTTIYLLNISRNGKTIKTFKIIKN